MIFPLVKSFRRPITIFMLCVIVLAFVILNETKSTADRRQEPNDRGGPIIDKITGQRNLERSKAEAAEASRQAAKIKKNEIELSLKPKFVRLSFFLNSPYRASIALPQEWVGKFRAEENNRSLELIYATTSNQTVKLLSILLLNDKEWQNNQKTGHYKILEKLPGFVFAIRDFTALDIEKNDDVELKHLQSVTGLAIKSFKSQKQ